MRIYAAMYRAHEIRRHEGAIHRWLMFLRKGVLHSPYALPETNPRTLLLNPQKLLRLFGRDAEIERCCALQLGEIHADHIAIHIQHRTSARAFKQRYGIHQSVVIGVLQNVARCYLRFQPCGGLGKLRPMVEAYHAKLRSRLEPASLVIAAHTLPICLKQRALALCAALKMEYVTVFGRFLAVEPYYRQVNIVNARHFCYRALRKVPWR